MTWAEVRVAFFLSVLSRNGCFVCKSALVCEDDWVNARFCNSLGVSFGALLEGPRGTDV